MDTTPTVDAGKSETMKNGIQLLRDVVYLGKAYIKAAANDNGTLSVVAGWGFVIGLVISVVSVVITHLLVESKIIQGYTGVWLLVGATVFFGTMPMIVRYVFNSEYNYRWKRIFKVECDIGHLLRDFINGETTKAVCDTKLAEYREDFDWITSILWKTQIYTPRKIDHIKAKEFLDKEFTYKAMDMCKHANLSYKDGLPDCVLENLDENGDLKKEVREKNFAKM